MSSASTPARHPRRHPARTIARIALGLALIFAGTSHLTFARDEFDAQVPNWVPMDRDTVVLLSGGVEITLGALLLAARKKRGLVGVITALFFVAIFPGNVSQWLEQRDAFGLDTEEKRFGRLFFQPLLVVWAWWSTGPRSRD